MNLQNYFVNIHRSTIKHVMWYRHNVVLAPSNPPKYCNGYFYLISIEHAYVCLVPKFTPKLWVNIVGFYKWSIINYLYYIYILNLHIIYIIFIL